MLTKKTVKEGARRIDNDSVRYEVNDDDDVEDD